MVKNALRCEIAIAYITLICFVTEVGIYIIKTSLYNVF